MPTIPNQSKPNTLYSIVIPAPVFKHFQTLGKTSTMTDVLVLTSEPKAAWSTKDLALATDICDRLNQATGRTDCFVAYYLGTEPIL